MLISAREAVLHMAYKSDIWHPSSISSNMGTSVCLSAGVDAEVNEALEQLLLPASSKHNPDQVSYCRCYATAGVIMINHENNLCWGLFHMILLKQDNVTWLADIHADVREEDYSGSSFQLKGVRPSRRNSMLSQQSSGGLSATDPEPFGSNVEPGLQSILRSSSTSMGLSLQPLDMPSGDNLQDGSVAMKDSSNLTTENMKAISPWMRFKRWISMKDEKNYSRPEVGQCSGLGSLSNANGQRKSVSFLVSTICK